MLNLGLYTSANYIADFKNIPGELFLNTAETQSLNAMF